MPHWLVPYLDMGFNCKTKLTMAIKKETSNNRKVLISAALMTATLIILLVLSRWVYVTIDATEERRYTLAPATKDLLNSLDERIYIRVLLDGRFPRSEERRVGKEWTYRS